MEQHDTALGPEPGATAGGAARWRRLRADYTHLHDTGAGAVEADGPPEACEWCSVVWSRPKALRPDGRAWLFHRVFAILANGSMLAECGHWLHGETVDITTNEGHWPEANACRKCVGDTIARRGPRARAVAPESESELRAAWGDR